MKLYFTILKIYEQPNETQNQKIINGFISSRSRLYFSILHNRLTAAEVFIVHKITLLICQVDQFYFGITGGYFTAFHFYELNYLFIRHK